MKRIEFVGASGIGKSALLHEVVKHKTGSDSWITFEEARVYLAKTIAVDKVSLRMSQLYLQSNLTRPKKLREYLVAKILDRNSRDIFDATHGKYLDLADAFLEPLHKYNAINSMRKMSLTAFYYQHTLLDTILLDYYKLNKVVVDDEGIIHNTLGFTDEERFRVVYENHANSETSVIPIAVVFCNLGEISYMQRRKNKILQGRGTVLERTFNDDELQKSCRRFMQSAAAKINVLKKFGIPVLEINMENPLQENAPIVYEFITDQSRQALCRNGWLLPR